MASRYQGCSTLPYATDGRTISYLSRRIIPIPETLAVTHAVTAVAGSRVDLIATKQLGMPTQSWRIADINAATGLISVAATPGATVLIPSPFQK